MRLIAFIAAAIIAGALPAQAAWKEYAYPDLGFAKYFPSEPKMEKGMYGYGIRLPLSKIVPSTILTAVDDGVTYKATVVDFKGREADGSNIMGEAISWLGGKGTVASTEFPRADLGNNSVYGLIMVVDQKDGNQATNCVYFNKGRLYILQAIVGETAPGKGDPGIGRFVETTLFHLAGYGHANGHDFPIGDDDPYDRDTGQKPVPEPGTVAPAGRRD
jgi:hypothetical protein